MLFLCLFLLARVTVQDLLSQKKSCFHCRQDMGGKLESPASAFILVDLNTESLIKQVVQMVQAEL